MNRIEVPNRRTTRAQMQEEHEAAVAKILERHERREGETSEEYCRRLFEFRKAEALSRSHFRLLDHPEPQPDEAPAIVALRSELDRLHAIYREKIVATFDAEEAHERAQSEEEAAHTAACKVFAELHIALDNCEIIVWRKNGRGKKRSFVEALPERGTRYRLSRIIRDLNAKYAQEGSDLVADLHERPYPPGAEEPADEPEFGSETEAFETSRELAYA